MAAEDSGCTVFVRNLPYDLSDKQLEQLFADIGPVRHAFVVTDKRGGADDGGSKGYGFVQFAMQTDAHTAVLHLNKTSVQGRVIKVEIAKNKGDNQPAKKSN